ncbi:MAG: threonine--tRNA ligase [bacterium]|nr:threonine--tRNA ligase [bacterium]
MAEQKDNPQLQVMRHSCEHVLTQTMLKLYPGLKMAMGPATDEGFYFDFDYGEKVSELDFPKIEEEMKKIIKEDLPFIRKESPIEEARKLFADNPYKLEWIDEIEKKKEKAILFSTGKDFVDLCSGPHLESTGEVGPFKLLSIAGAYWRGSEKNKMLTRIYGTAFETQEELDKYLKQLEEAKRRDHRKLNQTLNLYFTSDDIGQGLITLLPNGAIIAEELEEWAKVTERKFGYVRVFTPHIASEKVFKISGHVPYYLESMYPPMRAEEKGEGEKDVYYLKPMNCAGHHLVFKSQVRSYRDLPLRVAEYGAVYRYEKSGELYGMMRTRGPIHQNDAHIFCTEEQAEEEFAKVMELHKYYYKTLGLTEKDYYLSFAIRDKENKNKYLGDDAIWDKAEKITLDFIKKSKIPYEIESGGAAFYGPKIDFCIKTVTGKVFAASTNQLDFFLPQAFDLKYVDRDGKEKTPVCIHRAPLGAHVRFIAFLTEHYAGAFPIWLSPCQVKILPISDRHLEYGKKIYSQLFENEIRAELDERNETLPSKIRDATLQKVPYMVIIGDRESESGQISVRTRDGRDLGQIELTKFLDKIKLEIESKS